MPVVHLTAAGMLPPEADALSAMARTPVWVTGLTSGRALHVYAEGAELALMDAALAARSMPLFHQGDDAFGRYTAALDARFAGHVARGDFAPGAWRFLGYDGEVGVVRTRAHLVCTCRPDQGCHLRVLAPHLVRAGWDVTLYGAPTR